MPPSNLNRIREILGLESSRSRSVETYLVTITPDMARELLKYNHNVRPIRPQIVANYALDIMRGAWRVTGEPIIFDRGGMGVNGQHRLEACIQADAPFKTNVVLGVEPEAVLSMDRGTKRELGDFLAGTLGLKDARAVASSIRLAFQIVERKVVDQSVLGLTNEELFAWYQNGHSSIVDDLQTVKPLWVGWPKGFTVTHATAILHASRFVEGVQYGDVSNFFRTMAQAEDLVEHRSPPAVLTRTFELMRHGSKSGRIQQPMAVATVIKALNMYLRGEEVPVTDAGVPKAGVLQWRSGPRAEPFPVIMPPDAELDPELAQELAAEL
jgi:hypothetical protein